MIRYPDSVAEEIVEAEPRLGSVARVYLSIAGVCALAAGLMAWSQRPDQPVGPREAPSSGHVEVRMSEPLAKVGARESDAGAKQDADLCEAIVPETVCRLIVMPEIGTLGFSDLSGS
jgi:hypothetical protein